MRKIRIFLSGGLGNQLFQLAAGIQLKPGLLTINISQINGEFELYEFLKFLASRNNIQISLETAKPSRSLLNLHNMILRSTQWRLNQTLKNYFLTTMISIYQIHERASFITENSLAKKTYFDSKFIESFYMIGYFQSEKVACEISEDLVLYLNQTYGKLEQTDLGHEPVLIMHIRRGDYASDKKIGMLSLEYFKNVFYLVTRTQKISTLKFFSNGDLDPKEIFDIPRNAALEVIDGNSALELLNLMRDGQLFVISNSTLSWWAAFVCENPDKQIYSPNPWFRNLPKPVNFIPVKWKSIQSKWVEGNTN